MSKEHCPIRLGVDLELPENAVTQKFGFIAQSGAGKTYAASKLVEELLEMRAPVVVLDPVGNWYGLRIGADGKAPGFSIPVFGGDHGDVELEPQHGERLARVVVDRNLSAVLDVSAFRKNERKRFVTDFAEAFFHESKRARTARMVVLEEAHLFAPQMSRGEERMLGAITDIVRLGRNYGLGSTLISQRPQSINKEVLNQVTALFVGQLSAAHERKAIDQWVVEQGSDRKWLSGLPKLPIGTMVLWSPQWLGTLRTVKIGKKRTLDASATPELGKTLVRATPAEIDVGELRAALEEPKEAAEQKPAKGKGARGDVVPAFTSGPTAESVAGEVSNARLEKANAELNTRVVTLERALQVVQGQRIEFAKTVRGMMRDVQASVSNVIAFLDPVAEQEQGLAVGEVQIDGKDLGTGRAVVKPRPDVPKTTSLPGKSELMLRQLARVYPGGLTRRQLGTAVDMSHRSSSFANYLSAANVGGLLVKEGALFKPSAKAFALIKVTPAKRAPEYKVMWEFWCQLLSRNARRMLETLRAAGGLTRDQLGAKIGMSHRSSSFANYLSELNANSLIQKDGDKHRVSDYLLGKSVQHA